MLRETVAGLKYVDRMKILTQHMNTKIIIGVASGVGEDKSHKSEMSSELKVKYSVVGWRHKHCVCQMILHLSKEWRVLKYAVN